MARTQIVLDPPGYKYCSEPGFQWSVTGQKLNEKALQTPDWYPALTHFINPPGSEWISTRPWQLDPDHMTRPAFAQDDYVLRKSDWAWAAGVDVVEANQSQGAMSDPYPSDEWLSINRVPATVPAPKLLDVDFAALYAAAGVEAEEGVTPNVLAVASMAPAGGSHADSPIANPYVTPYIQARFLRKKWQPFIFGFNNLALVISPEKVIVLRDKAMIAGRGKQWEHVGEMALKGKNSATPGGGHDSLITVAPRPQSALDVDLLLMPSGTTDLCLFSGDKSQSITLVDPARPSTVGNMTKIMEPGSWWIAGIPDQRIFAQIQVVGYQEGEYPTRGASVVTGGGSGGGTPETLPVAPALFDTTENYLPSVEPDRTMRIALSMKNAGEGVVWTAPENSIGGVATSIAGCRAEYRIYEATSTGGEADWKSNGTQHTGGLHIKLTPSDDTYKPTQLRLIELRFPPVLTDRVATPLTLDDTQFINPCAESSWRDPEGKRFTADLTPSGMAAVIAANMDLRGNYPLHWEDTDGNILARAWVQGIDIKEAAVESALRSDGVRTGAIKAKGLLAGKCSQAWQYLPQMIDPQPRDHTDTPQPDWKGYVESRYAVMETLRMCGLSAQDGYVPDGEGNPTSEPKGDAWIHCYPDPYEGTTVSRLPGTWGGQDSITGVYFDSPWAPRWSEQRLQYMQTVAEEWRGWKLWERLASVEYAPDLLAAVQGGWKYWPVATIYRSSVEAEAAGFPGQYYQEGIERNVEEPEGNTVRGIGKDANGKGTLLRILRDERSLSDPTYENYIGEPAVAPMEISRFAVSERALRQVMTTRLLRATRRGFIRTITVPLAPWQFLPLLGVGSVVVLQGMGVYLIINASVKLLRGDGGTGRGNLYVTQFTGYKLPAGAVEGSGPGDYPGAGA